jgi:lysophospholipase L1-like esterase
VALVVANDITENKEGQKLELKPKEVKKLFIGVYKRIRKQLGNDIPIFKIETTPTPKRWEVWPKISKANNLIKAYIENRKNIYFISTRDYYLNNNGKPIKEYFMEDQLHLNIKGYKLWGEIIKKEIEKIL